MPQQFYIIPVPESGGPHPEHPIAPGGPPPTIWPSPGHPEHPIVLPPLPGIWPSPGTPTHPIFYPPYPAHPIVIPDNPEKPIQQPPGTIWPPLPPDTGLDNGTYALLIWVVGVGYRWLIVKDMGPKVQPVTQSPQHGR